MAHREQQSEVVVRDTGPTLAVMSPKAKVARAGDGDAESAVPAASNPDPSPFDSQEFLEANRRNRDKMRAAAQARRAKEAARAQRRASPWWKRSAAGAATPVIDQPSTGAATSDTDTPEAATGAVAASPGRSWITPVLALLLVVALVAAGVFAYLYQQADARANDADQINELRPGAVEIAGKYATELMTYDSANFAELDERITDISTPAFAKDFIEGSRQAREGSVNAQAVASASVKDAGIQSISSTEAVVLVALDQTITSPQTNGELPGGIPYQSRVKVTLARDGDGWKLSDLNVI